MSFNFQSNLNVPALDNTTSMYFQRIHEHIAQFQHRIQSKSNDFQQQMPRAFAYSHQEPRFPCEEDDEDIVISTTFDKAQVEEHSSNSDVLYMRSNVVSNHTQIRMNTTSEGLAPIAEDDECSSTSSVSSSIPFDPYIAAFTPNSSVSPPSSPGLSPTPSNCSSSYKINKRIHCKTLLKTKYPSRAKYNIFIPKDLTKRTLNIILERFPSCEALYYYMDISTALQLNDEQMSIFQLSEDEHDEIVLVNYDLHDATNGDMLYGVIGLNNGHEKKHGQWRWQLLHFMTAHEIHTEYGICYNELPLSSRRMNVFQTDLEMQRNIQIESNIIYTTNWSKVRQIRSFKRNQNYKKKKFADSRNAVMRMGDQFWLQQCQRSWHKYDAIPIVVNSAQDNSHWIEWIKLIEISDGQFVGVSCKYNQDMHAWNVTAICLDKGDVENKNRLMGFHEFNIDGNYLCFLQYFNTVYTEIQWIRSE